MENVIQWDLFVSHATEDKIDFVEPLVKELLSRGAKVWYDQFSMKLGDSLRRKIDEGLSKSRYGIVVLSPSFLTKEWPQKELDGLVSREINGEKVILPIWHKINRQQLAQYSPILADKIAITTDKGIASICDAIMDVIGTKKPNVTEQKTETTEQIVNFSYVRVIRSGDLHEYTLKISIKNNSFRAITSFKLVFSFPVECIIDRNGFDVPKNDYHENRVRYTELSYNYSKILYPQEELDIVHTEQVILHYKMDHNLYWKFRENYPIVNWTLYLPEGNPIRGSIDFMTLQSF
jgi:hypothetical protein